MGGKSIVFSRPVNGLTNLWKYRLDDRSLTQLTFGSGPDSSPMPDPSGKGIYYVTGKASGFLTRYNVRDRTTTDIVADDVSMPTISPDGKRVMYARWLGPSQNELWVSDLDGANRLKLASGLVGTGDWPPDRSRLSFMDTTGTQNHV